MHITKIPADLKLRPAGIFFGRIIYPNIVRNHC